MAPRETGNNAYSNFWGDRQRALWYVVVFSGAVNYAFAIIGALRGHKDTRFIGATQIHFNH